jgi:hypothetical protein
VPARIARTCFSKAISRSTDARISDTPINPPGSQAANSIFARLSHCMAQRKLLASGYDRRLLFCLQMNRSLRMRQMAFPDR